MKKLIVILSLVLLGLSMMAQSDALYSLYRNNKLVINPAFAGSREMVSFTASHRSQWAGFEGAPVTSTLAFHNVSKDRKMGYGATAFRDAIGPVNEYSFYGIYSYRFLLEKGVISLGLQGGLNFFNTNWQELTAFQGGDVGTFGNGNDNDIVPQFGAGFYFYSKKVSVGFSAPHLISNKIYSASDGFHSNHYYITFDYLWELNDQLSFVPSTLVKFAKNTNSQVDLNLNVVILRSIWVGAGFRSNNSWNVSAQYQLKLEKENSLTKIRVGYAFDLANKEFRDQTSNSHEVFLIYEFKRSQKEPELSSALF